MRKHVLTQAILLTLGGAMLSGCGDGSSPATPPAADSGSISGVSSKGIIKNGSVTAEELGKDGKSLGVIVGTADTNEKGEYSLKLNEHYKGGPLLLTIKGKSGGATTMVCDVQGGCSGTAYGQAITLTDSFSLKAVLPAVKGGATVNAQITPFSDMAAARVQAAGSADDDAIKKVISEVNQIVGVNILETRPLDITDAEAVKKATTEQLIYAVFNAAAGKIALANAEGLTAGLAQSAKDFEDGKLASTESLFPTELGKTVKTQLDSIKDRADAVDAIKHQLYVIEKSIHDGVYNPEPTSGGGGSSGSTAPSLSPVEQAKQLVGQARTLGNSVASLESPAQAFKADVDVAANVIDDESNVLVSLTGTIVEQVLNALMAQDTITLGPKTVAIKDYAGNPIGDATVTLADNNGLTISISAPSINSASVSLSLSSNAPASLLNGTAAELSNASFTITGRAENANARLSLTDMSLSAAFAQAVTFDPNAYSLPEPVLKSLDFDGTITLEDLKHAMSFTGAASFNLVALNASAARSLDGAPNPLSLAKADLSGTFAGNGNRFTASAKLDVSNAASFDTFAYLDYEPRMWAEYPIDGDTLKVSSYAADNLGIISYADAFAGSSFDGTVETCFSGQDASSNHVQTCVPGDVLKAQEAFTAKLAELNPNITTQYPDMRVAGFGFRYNPTPWDYQTETYTTPTTWLYGNLDLGSFESASNFAKGSLSVNLDLALKGYPNTSAVITVNRTELEGGDALVTLLHNGSTVTFKLVKTGANPTDGTLTVSNPDGVKLIVTAKDGDVTGKATLADGTQVGTVEKSGNGLYIIRYADGTFETLQ